MKSSIEGVLTAVKKLTEENATLKRSIARGDMDNAAALNAVSHSLGSRSADASRSRMQFAQVQVSTLCLGDLPYAVSSCLY
jgi:hypothetical protein